MGFSERLSAELDLLRAYYDGVRYLNERGHWFQVPGYALPEGWSASSISIPFEVKETHPGTPPYGLYVPTDLTFNGQVPNNRNANPPQPPFPGQWALLSWTPAAGWHATADLRTGSNLLQWVRGFSVRFGEGR